MLRALVHMQRGRLAPPRPASSRCPAGVIGLDLRPAREQDPALDHPGAREARERLAADR